MGRLPTFETEYADREVTDVFAGYNHQLKTADGEFYETMNLSTAYYPLLANRPKRGLVQKLSAMGGILAKDKLAYVDNGTLYYDGQTMVTGLAPGHKQLVSMGAYIVVFPDGMYYNTAEPTDYGGIDSRFGSVGNVKYTMCKLDGTAYSTTPTASDTAPESPSNGDLWIDSAQEQHVLKQYSEASTEWVEIATVYTKITFTSSNELPGLFSEHDGVAISGADVETVNGDKVIYGIGTGDDTFDYIIVVGLLDAAVTQTTGTVEIKRSAPEMDYVIEAQNRLWGCRYGEGVNELYCSALGDFKNWRQYRGISTDSWAASVGSDGAWTGAANYLGCPTFFKEDRLYRITVSAIGAHSVSETVCRGVQAGSGGSVQVVNETLLYKSRNDICAYRGGFPSSISTPLGDMLYSEACAGAVGDRYYISMKDRLDTWHLFVYDMKRGLWIHEDNLHVTAFSRMGDELYAIADNRIWAMLGSTGEKEAYVQWAAETGLLYYQYPDRKYVSRFNCRLQMEPGAELHMYIMYDSDGQWRKQGSIRFKGHNTVTVPIRPRRCDHMRIKLTGKGEIRLFSIARVLSFGSDVDGGYMPVNSRDDIAVPGEKQEVRTGGEAYTGSCVATPSLSRQVFTTEGKTMPNNFVVEPIPNNYGLIAYNGFEITVS